MSLANASAVAVAAAQHASAYSDEDKTMTTTSLPPPLPPPMCGYSFVRHMRSAQTHDTFLARVDDNGDDKHDDVGSNGSSKGGATVAVVAAAGYVVVRVYALAYLRRDAATRHALEREALVSRIAQHAHIASRRRAWVTHHDVFTVEDYYGNGELYECVARLREGARAAATPDGDNDGGSARVLAPLQRLLRELMLALEHLHVHCRLAHRNVKLETIYLDEAGHVHLGGLGQCAVLPRRHHTHDRNKDATVATDADGLLQVCCGSRHYAAPEVVCGVPYDGTLVDVWAAGVVFFALITGCFPFDGAEAMAAAAAAAAATTATSDDDKDDENGTRVARVCACYDVAAALQTHADALAQHDMRASDLLRNMLRVDPAARYTVREVLEHAYLRDVA